MTWVTSIWKSLTDKRIEAPYDEDWSSHKKWFDEDFAPCEGINYEDLKSYAMSQYEEMRSNDETVDRKAEWLFGIGLVGFGAIVAFVQRWGFPEWPFAFSLAMVSISLILSLKARIPGKTPSPMSIRDAIYCDEQNYHSAAWITASVHGTVIGLAKVVNWKAQHVIDSARSMLCATGLFALAWFACPLIQSGCSSQGPGTSQVLQIQEVSESAAATAAEVGPAED